MAAGGLIRRMEPGTAGGASGAANENDRRSGPPEEFFFGRRASMKTLKGSKTEKNLLGSFAGESQARNRYTYFASQAK